MNTIEGHTGTFEDKIATEYYKLNDAKNKYIFDLRNTKKSTLK